MIRIRSQKLLSGVSALAVLAAFGAVDPVLAAGTTIAGPGNKPAVNTSTDTAPGTRDFVTINGNANVGVDGSGRSFYNPTGIIITGAATSVQIDNAVLQGDITNDGSLVSTAQDGIEVSTSIVHGAIVNGNYISSFLDGIEVFNSVVDGGIVNTSTVTAADTGIAILTGAVLNGGIDNSGFVGGEVGIDIDAGASVTGGISNTGSLSVIQGTSGIAIDIAADSFAGGISNDGLITSTTTAIRINGAVFTGGISNTDSGTIITSGTSDAGIDIAGSLFDGGITNAGLISATLTSGVGILVEGNTFKGGITNSGSIGGYVTGISVVGNLFQGGIENSGDITSSNGVGISFAGTTFQGGINNKTGGDISASSDGVNISGTSFAGGITNAGVIDSTGSGNAIDINGVSFDGGITNSGQVLSGTLADAVAISGGTFSGGIKNSGKIVGVTNGVNFTGTTFNGGINNEAAGVIDAWDNAAINIDATSGTFAGGITNAGRIGGATSANSVLYGVLFNGPSFAGGINNSGTIQGYSNGIQLNGTSFTGGITNSGLIETTNTENAILITTATFTGGIDNKATGVISGDTGINLTGGSFEGGITNAGLIEGTSTLGVIIASTTFSGGVNNSGVIQGNDGGLLITSATFEGGLTNDGGTIAGTGAAGYGVLITSTSFAGGVDNSGLIKGVTATGLHITSSTFTGGIVNSGTISGDAPGLLIAVTNFTGGIDNQEGALIQGTGASGDGVKLTAQNFTGDFTNAGAIVGSTANNSGVDLVVQNFFGDFTNSSTGSIQGYNRGVFLDGGLFSGDVSNAGSIDSINGEGLRLAMNLLAGDVTNDGTITAANDALKIVGGTTVTGAVTNNGYINSTNSDGIDINGLVQGALTNTGTVIASGNALDLDGTITGQIFNSGTLLSYGEGAVDLTGEAVAHTITQTAGGFISDSGGEGNYAINFNNAFIDTFNANGGAVEGDILGNGTDLMAVAGNFAYLRGTANDLDQLTINSGTGVFGSEAVGTDGVGVSFTSLNDMVVNGGTAYLDDNTDINPGDDLTVAANGTLAYYLTSTEATHGVVAAGDDAVLAGTLLAVIDPVSFVAANLDTFTYTNLITTGANGVNGTFDQVTTSSLFWEADGLDADYFTNHVDLTINRIDFGDVLNELGLIQTQNQQSIGNALESIYTGSAPFGTQFTDLFEALFTTTDPAEVLAMYDEINGSEHAQIQQTTLGLSSLLNGAIGERLDSTLLSLGGSQMNASLDGQQYAQAATSASDAMGGGAMGSHGLNRGASGVSIWARGFGQWANTDTDPEASGYNQDSDGGAAGVDVAIGNNATIGAAGSFANTSVDFDTAGDNADIDSWQAGAYGSVGFGSFYTDGLVSYASHDVSAQRVIDLPVPGAPFLASSSYNATAWSAQGEVGAIWRLGRVNMQPSAGLAYTSASTDGFTETGNANAYNLIVQGADADSFASTLALRGSGQWLMGRTRVVPDLKIGWRHEFNDERQTFTAAFSEDPTTLFNIVSSAVQPDSAVVSAGVTAGVTQNIEIFVDLNGLYNADQSVTNASGGLRLTW